MSTLAERDNAVFLRTYRRMPVEFVRGEGSRLIDHDGRMYLDLFGGLAVNLLGYGRADVRAAAAAQMDRYFHVSNLFLQSPQIELAERLTARGPFPRCFLCNSGTEAIEAAFKLARRWGASQGRTEYVTFDGAFHGRTLGALALMPHSDYARGFDAQHDAVRQIPYNDVGALRAAVSNATSAVFLEFLQGEGGVRPASASFIAALEALRHEHGFLVVADEIQAGMGRTGAFYSFEHYDIRPDLVTLAKSLGGGLPLGALLAAPHLGDVFQPGDHGSTFGGNPVACAAGSAVLAALEREDRMARAAVIGETMMRGLRALRERFPALIADVRGRGCMIGVELTAAATTVRDEAFARGLLVNVTQGRVIRLLPPLTLLDGEIAEALDILGTALQSVAHTIGGESV